jgi:hypothetical protein
MVAVLRVGWSQMTPCVLHVEGETVPAGSVASRQYRPVWVLRSCVVPPGWMGVGSVGLLGLQQANTKQNSQGVATSSGPMAG